MYSFLKSVLLSCWEQEHCDIPDTSFRHSFPIRLDCVYHNRLSKQTVIYIVSQ